LGFQSGDGVCETAHVDHFMNAFSAQATSADFVPLTSRFLSEVNKILLIKVIGNVPQKNAGEDHSGQVRRKWRDR